MEAHIAAKWIWQNSRFLDNIVRMKFMLPINRWGKYSAVSQKLCNKELYLLLLQKMIYVYRWKEDKPDHFYMEGGL